MLANFALDGLEHRLRKAFPHRGKGSERGKAAQVHLVRYADDFIITGQLIGVAGKEGEADC